MNKKPQRKRIPILLTYPLVTLVIAAAVAAFALLYDLGGANILPEETPSPAPTAGAAQGTPSPATASNKGRLLPYREAGIWGYKNASGEVVIAAQFGEAKEFEEDCAFAKDAKSELYGLLDRSGNWIADPTWTDVRPFSSGRAAVQKDGASWGYIDAKGRIVVDYLYRDAGEYSCGRARVRTADRWGYIDSQGDRAIEEEWAECNDFAEDLAFASMRRDGKTTWYIIDKAGTRVATLAAGESGTAYSGGFAVLKKSGGESSYINSKGRTALSGSYGQAEAFSGGLAAVKEKESKLWGYINTTGKLVIEPQYADARPFSGGFAAVKEKESGLWGYVDRNGVQQIPFRFENAGEFRQNSASVTENGLVGLINASGTFVLLYQ